ncbi:MAG TPA: methyltransferase [Acidobacteriaceae bacterium]|nr:methyltransferase [Acidobacteriaceae bacterium]
MSEISDRPYDQLWTSAWGDLQHQGPVHRRQREALLNTIASLAPRSVLDVGCGSGNNLAAIAATMPDIVLTGTDVSSEALALAAHRVPSAALHLLDAQRETLDGQFDLVLSNQVIEHLLDDAAALRNMARMARQWVLVATMRGRMRSSEIAIGHYRNYSDAELRAKAETAGLEIVDIYGWGFPFYSPLYRTVSEWLPGGPPTGEFGRTQKLVASLLYHLYALNVPRRGDVVTMLARPRAAATGAPE